MSTEQPPLPLPGLEALPVPPDHVELLAEVTAERKRKGRRVAYILATIIVLVATVAVGAVGALLWLDATRWDPLGEYPLQVITRPVDAVPIDPEYRAAVTSLPTVYLDQTVHTSGVKCVKDEAGIINVTGVLSWVSDRPPGRVIEVGRGGGKRGPGCVNYEFDNIIPDKVKAEVLRLSEQGIYESDWHLTGTETPVKPDGTEGESRTWVSTSVRIIHRPAPEATP